MLEIGDRVVVTGTMSGKTFRNAHGTVLCAGIPGRSWLVEFDEYINGHDGSGKGRDGYCWNVNTFFCDIAPEEDDKDTTYDMYEIIEIIE